jgi:hypothetical protein
MNVKNARSRPGAGAAPRKTSRPHQHLNRTTPLPPVPGDTCPTCGTVAPPALTSLNYVARPAVGGERAVWDPARGRWVEVEGAA